MGEKTVNKRTHTKKGFLNRSPIVMIFVLTHFFMWQGVPDSHTVEQKDDNKDDNHSDLELSNISDTELDFF